MARRRYQTGCVFKRGKRRKVWVARWREDVLCEDGKVGRILRSVVLGAVADLPTRKDAQVRLDEELRAVNQGTVRPESSMLFGTFAEEQWKTLVLPTLNEEETIGPTVARSPSCRTPRPASPIPSHA